MVKAEWNGQVIAESDTYETVEGNIYFPPSSLKKEFFVDSSHQTTCPFKGEASYYTVSVNGKTNKNAAWYYPSPKPVAAHIKNYVAFWNGVVVTK
ncbi:1878_t:CDS:2 [Ambispora gerdemannii]|uniref:1878_t:CDS:1 n=1 Tax=Ambispora gerdemannii TaxID=144530 RepID=A0A9N9F374_9GLOM|nr:1878_t:CDS:2 [Ambispora gerdemannii]